MYLIIEVIVFSPEYLKSSEKKIIHEPPERLRQRYASLLKTSGLENKVSLSLFNLGMGATAFSLGVRSRCIVISEGLLANLHEEEIDIILAHEIAHHANKDAWRMCAATILLVAGVAFLDAQTLPRFTGVFGITSVSDPAALPLLLLLSNVFALIFSPLFNLYSRRRELAADQYALSLTKNRIAFTSALKRIADLELAPYDITPIERLFFARHPPIRERLSLADPK
jgi:STE24 endopeptidase